MLCRACGGETYVADSRPTTDNSLRRRRICSSCARRFTTYEVELDYRHTAAYLHIRHRGKSVSLEYVRPIPNAIVYAEPIPGALAFQPIPATVDAIVGLFAAMGKLNT